MPTRIFPARARVALGPPPPIEWDANRMPDCSSAQAFSGPCMWAPGHLDFSTYCVCRWTRTFLDAGRSLLPPVRGPACAGWELADGSASRPGQRIGIRPVQRRDFGMTDRKRKLEVYDTPAAPVAAAQPPAEGGVNPFTGRAYSTRYYDILATRQGIWVTGAGIWRSETTSWPACCAGTGGTPPAWGRRLTSPLGCQQGHSHPDLPHRIPGPCPRHGSPTPASTPAHTRPALPPIFSGDQGCPSGRLGRTWWTCWPHTRR